MGCEAQPEVCGTPGGKNRIGGRRSAWLQHEESGKRRPSRKRVRGLEPDCAVFQGTGRKC